MKRSSQSRIQVRDFELCPGLNGRLDILYSQTDGSFIKRVRLHQCQAPIGALQVVQMQDSGVVWNILNSLGPLLILQPTSREQEISPSWASLFRQYEQSLARQVLLIFTIVTGKSAHMCTNCAVRLCGIPYDVV